MAHRILLVEDDPSIRELTTIGLHAAGYEVIAAADGRDGLDRFTAEKPDAVVLDIMLPVLDGLAVCRTIRRQSAVPIIMLTARTDAFDVVAGLEAANRSSSPSWSHACAWRCAAPGRPKPAVRSCSARSRSTRRHTRFVATTRRSR